MTLPIVACIAAYLFISGVWFRYHEFAGAEYEDGEPMHPADKVFRSSLWPLVMPLVFVLIVIEWFSPQYGEDE